MRVSVVAHIFDVAHDLGIEPVERLLDPAVLRDQDDTIRKLVSDRLALTADGARWPSDRGRRPSRSPSANRCGSKAARPRQARPVRSRSRP